MLYVAVSKRLYVLLFMTHLQDVTTVELAIKQGVIHKGHLQKYGKNRPSLHPVCFCPHQAISPNPRAYICKVDEAVNEISFSDLA